MRFYKYQGAGNDFLIADNRDGGISLTEEQIAALCDRRYGVGADGLMLLEASGSYDFRMTYYNSDGSGGMMCGNGGRCIVAFAADMGLSRDIRYNGAELQPVGANVNFVQPFDGGIMVRTYEKGVEDETFACGTGIVASCIAAYNEGVRPSMEENGRVRYDVRAKRDSLAVDFKPADIAEDVWLTGPATLVAEIIIPD